MAVVVTQAFRALSHRGADAWDDYLFQPVASGSAETIEVMADVPVQVEPQGAVFRMRRRGEVLHLQWQLPDGAPGAEDDQRTRFLTECIRPWGEDSRPQLENGAHQPPVWPLCVSRRHDQAFMRRDRIFCNGTP